MYQVLRTEEFNNWITGLRDKVGQKQVLARLTRLSLGHWGDCKPVGGEVTELRIDTGPGYRVYCTRRGKVLYLLLLGGDKSSQKRDIQRAIDMAHEVGNE